MSRDISDATLVVPTGEENSFCLHVRRASTVGASLGRRAGVAACHVHCHVPKTPKYLLPHCFLGIVD